MGKARLGIGVIIRDKSRVFRAAIGGGRTKGQLVIQAEVEALRSELSLVAVFGIREGSGLDKVGQYVEVSGGS